MDIELCYKQAPSNFVAKQLCKRCEKKLQNIPNSWDALAPRQYLAIMGVLNSGVTFEDQLLQTLFILIDQPWDADMQYYIKHFITTDQLWLSTGLCEFIADDEKRLSKNHLPRIRIKGKNYYGPADNMQDVIFSQFMDIDHIYMFDPSDQLTKLAKTASILYLPKGEQYHTLKSQKRVDYFKSISKNELYAIGYFYSSVRATWAAQLPNLFVSSAKGGDSNWAEALMAMSQDPARVTENSEQEAMTVLMHMDQTIKTQKEYETQLKNG